MFSFLQDPFQGFLQCSNFYSSKNQCDVFALKAHLRKTATCRGELAESKIYRSKMGSTFRAKNSSIDPTTY